MPEPRGLTAWVEAEDPRMTEPRQPITHHHNDLYYTKDEGDDDVANLLAAIAGKVDDGDPRLSDPRTPTTHNHDTAYEAKNANIQQHISAAHAPATAQKNSDITKPEIEGKLTGEITSHTHPAVGGGSDPWNYVQVNNGNDFTTTSTTAQDVTGLSFVPSANQRYIIEAVLGVRTATATVNPRLGLAWATGLTDGIATIEQTSTATAKIMANGNISASLLLAVGGIPNNSQSWPALVYGFVRAGAAPSGSIRIQLASETNGTVVRVVAGSYLRYRTY